MELIIGSQTKRCKVEWTYSSCFPEALSPAREAEYKLVSIMWIQLSSVKCDSNTVGEKLLLRERNMWRLKCWGDIWVLKGGEALSQTWLVKSNAGIQNMEAAFKKRWVWFTLVASEMCKLEQIASPFKTWVCSEMKLTLLLSTLQCCV